MPGLRASPEARFRQRFLGASLFTLTLVAIGTAGFSSMPGWSLSDGFYMTVITLSSVGYEEVRPLESTGGPLFATLMVLGSVAALGIWFALITSTLVEMDLAHAFRRRRTMNAIEKIRNHIIVCGGGRMGRQVIKELVKSRMPYVVIEIDPDGADKVRELDPDALILEGDATHDEMLIQARNSPLDGVALAKAEIPRKTGLIALAIKHGEDRREPFIYNPGPNEQVRCGDPLIVLGRPEQLDRLRATLA